MSDDEKKERLKEASKIVDLMLAGFPEYQRQRLMQSYCVQDPEERKARLKLVQELSIELADIRTKERFVLFGETAIEAVIEGDWKGVAERIEWLSFNKDPLEHMEAKALVWAKFREMLHVACVEQRIREAVMTRHVLGQKEGN